MKLGFRSEAELTAAMASGCEVLGVAAQVERTEGGETKEPAGL